MDPTGATTLGPGFAMANPGSYMTGAHWLVYELAGPDRLGYAEPRNIVNPTTTGIDVNDLPGTRQGPYIATEDANLVPDEDPNTPGTGTPNPELHMMVRDGAGDWGDIPAGDRRVTGLYLLRDSFDSPILYYAANRGAHRPLQAPPRARRPAGAARCCQPLPASLQTAYRTPEQIPKVHEVGLHLPAPLLGL